MIELISSFTLYEWIGIYALIGVLITLLGARAHVVRGNDLTVQLLLIMLLSGILLWPVLVVSYWWSLIITSDDIVLVKGRKKK